MHMDERPVIALYTGYRVTPQLTQPNNDISERAIAGLLSNRLGFFLYIFFLYALGMTVNKPLIKHAGDLYSQLLKRLKKIK